MFSYFSTCTLCNLLIISFIPYVFFCDLASNFLSIFSFPPPPLVHTHVDQQLNPASIHLQEDPNHELPFLLPEHGYSCDTMRGVPVGLEEFLENVTNAGTPLSVSLSCLSAMCNGGVGFFDYAMVCVC